MFSKRTASGSQIPWMSQVQYKSEDSHPSFHKTLYSIQYGLECPDHFTVARIFIFISFIEMRWFHFSIKKLPVLNILEK